MSEGWAAVARARNLMTLRRYDAVLEALGPAIADESTRAEAWCLRTQAHLGRNELRAALPAAREAIAADPQGEWGHRLLSITLARGGNSKDALRAAEEAARLAPHQAEVLHVLACSQWDRRQKKEARATVQRMLELHPHNALSYETAGVIAASDRDWHTAEGHLRQALRLEPDDAEVARLLAEVLKNAGRRAEAGRVLLAAGRADPTNSDVRKAMSRLGGPALAFGGFTLFKVLAAMQFSRLITHLRPAPATVVSGLFFIVVGGYFVHARYAGTRELPDHVHRSLTRDHRNYALAWLGWAGAAALALAAFAAVAPQGRGQSFPLATGLVVFAVAVAIVFQRMWTGPWPDAFPTVTAWRTRRRERQEQRRR